MSDHIFISYAHEDKDLIENLRYRLSGYGVEAWVYSLDKTLAKHNWDEIQSKILSSRVVIFAVSQFTKTSKGQKKELEIVLRKSHRIFPLMLRDTPFENLPKELRNINGDSLDAYNVKTVAFNITKLFSPELLKDRLPVEWEYPVPGQWLEVCQLDKITEEYFEIGDKLYFRRIDPLGLFECYAPKIGELFWIAPQNVKRSITIDDDKIREQNIPFMYTISGMIDIEFLGHEAYRKKLG